MSSDLYGTCSTWKSLVTAFTGQTLPQGGTHTLVAAYIDSLVMISIERSETNKKRALEI